jgi:hypothetical protein
MITDIITAFAVFAFLGPIIVIIWVLAYVCIRDLLKG